MLKRHGFRSAVLIGLLLLVILLAFAPLLHAHADTAALPVVLLLTLFAATLPTRRAPSAFRERPLPLRPSLRQVLIQLPPPNLLG